MAHRFTWNGEAVKSDLMAKADQAKKAWAELMAERAYQLCPKDTGFLSSTIGVIESNTGDAYVVVVRAYYAFYVEFGHNGPGGWVPGRYFMTTAMMEAETAFPEIVQQSFVAAGATTDSTRWQIGVSV